MTHAKEIDRKTGISQLLHTRNTPQTQRQTGQKSKGYEKGPKKQAGVATLISNITFQNNKSKELKKTTY